MYDVHKTVDLIKKTAKSSGISTTVMLEECGLNKNTLSSMNSRGSWITSESLAKIADYLNVSVDYLLGRLPQSMPPETFAEAHTESEWTEMLSALDDDDLLKVKSYVEFLVSQKSDSAKK